MNDEILTPKVFISYCHQPLENKEWVKNLADRLIDNGIDVEIDIYGLKSGNDQFVFMEKMVNDPEICKVLLVCNKEYVEKANVRKGGAGTESMIITPEIYSKVNQTKFIPIIRESDENGDPLLPAYIKSRIGVDFRKDIEFEEKLEELTRDIYEKPKHTKPPLGKLPEYLSESSSKSTLVHKINPLKNAIYNHAPNLNYLLQDFFKSFVNVLDNYVIDHESIENKQELDEAVFNSINEMLILKNEYVDCLFEIIKLPEEFYSELVHKFFEDFNNFIDRNSDSSLNYTNHNLSVDNFKFLLWEIFIYTFTILARENKFATLSLLINKPYYLSHKYLNSSELEDFVAFDKYVRVLNEMRNNRLQMRRISFQSDLFVDRCNETIPFQELRNNDLLLYYISFFSESGKRLIFRNWYPRLSVYRGYGAIDLINKAKSKQFFDKVKILFSVDTVDELQKKLDDLVQSNKIEYLGYGWEIPDFKYALMIDKLATLK